MPGFYSGQVNCDLYSKNSQTGEERFEGSDGYFREYIEVGRNGLPSYYITTESDEYGTIEEPRVGLRYTPIVDLSFSSVDRAEILGFSNDLLGISITSRDLFVLSSLNDTLSDFINNGRSWSFEGYILDIFAHADYDEPENNIQRGDLLIVNYFEGKGEEFEYEYQYGTTYDSISYICTCVASPIEGG